MPGGRNALHQLLYTEVLSNASDHLLSQSHMVVGIPLLLLFRRDLDTIVYPQQTRRRLQGRLETLDLTDGGFQDARLTIIHNLSVEEVEAVEEQSALWVRKRSVLSGIVECSKFRDEVCRVFCGVDGEGFGDGE